MKELSESKLKNVTAFNGINQTSPDTVFTISGINRKTPLQYSGIIYRLEEDSQKVSNIHQWKLVTSPVTYRRFQGLHIHKLDTIIEVDTIEVDTVSKELIQLLQYEKVKEKDKTGKAFTTWVYKEKRGESITISYSHKEQKYYIRVITHKLNRLLKFKEYIKGLRVETIKTFTFETYIRYHERYELRVAKSIEALDLEIGGKGLNTDKKKANQGKHDYFISNTILEYKGVKVYIKSYRHKHYYKYEKTHPEYHPKLEQSTTLHNIPITTDLTQLIKEYSILVHTIAYTLNIKVIIGEYEKTTDKIRVEITDPQITKYIKGITKRLIGETILLEQLKDKRLVVAKLLVEKSLTPSQISKILGYSRIHIHRIIEELIEAGIISRVKRGKYTWTKRKAELPKPQTKRHTHVRTIQELVNKVKEIRSQHKLINIETYGNIVVNYETEHERVRLITNVISNSNYTEIIDPITHRRHIIKITRHQLTQLLIA